MKKLLIATTNPGKLGEIRAFLSELPVECVGLADVGITQPVEETGASFAEIAVAKARAYAALSGLPTVADDGGFEIDALGGEPGIKSHRWIHGDREDTDQELIDYTMRRMEGVPDDKRGAGLHVVLAFVAPDGAVATGEGFVRGVIPHSPSVHRTPGFPYRALLYLPELGKFYDHAELTPEENDRYNHRKAALAAIIPAIRSALC